MRLVAALLLASALAAQTIPVDLVVNWPPAALVKTKYGKIPKWAMFGEVTGCNKGTTGVTYGQGDVIALLRSQGNLQAFSVQDAMSLVGNAQGASLSSRAIGWVNAAASSVVGAKAAGLIGGGSGTGIGIVIGAEAVKILLPNVQGVLSLKQVIAYSQDGLGQVMWLPAGRCTVPYSVLFATPGPSPDALALSKTTVLHADVPANR